MAYYAEWCVFIEGEDLDPMEVARLAREKVNDERYNAWHIVDIDNLENAVVDLNTGKYIMERASKKASEAARKKKNVA